MTKPKKDKKGERDLESYGQDLGQQYIDVIDGLYGDGVFDRFLAKIHKAVSKVALAAALRSPEMKNLSKQDKESRARLKKFGDAARRRDPKGWEEANRKLNKKLGLPDDA
jgi:hypothetical protein